MNKLEFFQERDLGSRIGLVFSFIKQNFKVLFIGGAFLLPAVLLINFIILYLGVGLGSSSGYTFMLTLLNGMMSLLYTLYIGVYAMEYTLADNPKSITLNYIWSKVFNAFPSVLGGYIMLSVVVGFYVGLITWVALGFPTNQMDILAVPFLFTTKPLLFAGFGILILIPCVWVSVNVILFIQAYLYSNKGIINAIKESYRLVKGKWWLSFGFILVCALIVAVLQAIGGIPLIASISLTNLGIVNSALLIYVATAISVTISFFATPIIVIATHTLYTDLKKGKAELIN